MSFLGDRMKNSTTICGRLKARAKKEHLHTFPNRWVTTKWKKSKQHPVPLPAPLITQWARGYKPMAYGGVAACKGQLVGLTAFLLWSLSGPQKKKTDKEAVDSYSGKSSMNTHMLNHLDQLPMSSLPNSYQSTDTSVDSTVKRYKDCQKGKQQLLLKNTTSHQGNANQNHI